MSGIVAAAFAVTIVYGGDATRIYPPERWTCEYLAAGTQGDRTIVYRFRVAGRQVIADRGSPRWVVTANDDRHVVATSSLSWMENGRLSTTANSILTIDKSREVFRMVTTYVGPDALEPETREGRCQRA